jgi:hypothetical protein
MWPVDDPPKPPRAAMHTTLKSIPGEAPVKFIGPANVLVALHACHQAAVEVVKTQEVYVALPPVTPVDKP